ncbi:MAG: SMP-30/gluconolactonase/LRE family protein [Asticcacaulis sp.]
MDDNEELPTGKLYRYDERGLKVMDDDYVITNGPAVSPDGKILYHNDTLKKVIYAFDLDAGGHLSNKRVFAQLDAAGTQGEHGEGYMDGPVVDSAGNVWNALFFGWCINCYAPDGRLLRKVRLPVSNVTKIAFGGHDLKTVYVATRRQRLVGRRYQATTAGRRPVRFETDIPGQPQNEIVHV